MGATDIGFTFMGSGDCREELVAERDRLGLVEHVEFTGRVPDETVEAVLRTADLGCAPIRATPSTTSPP